MILQEHFNKLLCAWTLSWKAPKSNLWRHSKRKKSRAIRSRHSVGRPKRGYRVTSPDPGRHSGHDHSFLHGMVTLTHRPHASTTDFDVKNGSGPFDFVNNDVMEREIQTLNKKREAQIHRTWWRVGHPATSKNWSSINFCSSGSSKPEKWQEYFLPCKLPPCNKVSKLRVFY